MSNYDRYAVELPSLGRQIDLQVEKEHDLEAAEDDEELWEIEQTGRSEGGASDGGCFDLLCLETACAGVLLSLWCELTGYARTFGVPKSVLRAMVQCAFLAELDKAAFWVDLEEEPRPLTREKYLKALKRAERIEAVRVQNAKYPYRVPEEKWRDLLNKAKAGSDPSGSLGV